MSNWKSRNGIWKEEGWNVLGRCWITPLTVEKQNGIFALLLIFLSILGDMAVLNSVQGISLRPFPGCENAAGKLRQKR